MGYLGAALATAISYWLQFLTLLVYILVLKVIRHSHKHILHGMHLGSMNTHQSPGVLVKAFFCCEGIYV